MIEIIEIIEIIDIIQIARSALRYKILLTAAEATTSFEQHPIQKVYKLHSPKVLHTRGAMFRTLEWSSLDTKTNQTNTR